jgi:hypothetical protein
MAGGPVREILPYITPYNADTVLIEYAAKERERSALMMR